MPGRTCDSVVMLKDILYPSVMLSIYWKSIHSITEGYTMSFATCELQFGAGLHGTDLNGRKKYLISNNPWLRAPSYHSTGINSIIERPFII